MSEQERIMNVALLWGGCFCLTAAFCLSMGEMTTTGKNATG